MFEQKYRQAHAKAQEEKLKCPQQTRKASRVVRKSTTSECNIVAINNNLVSLIKNQLEQQLIIIELRHAEDD